MGRACLGAWAPGGEVLEEDVEAGCPLLVALTGAARPGGAPVDSGLVGESAPTPGWEGRGRGVPSLVGFLAGARGAAATLGGAGASLGATWAAFRSGFVLALGGGGSAAPEAGARAGEVD